ncbi:helix-turn-helix domain-containing protein, partial [Glutamicibacter ardleyensis]|uniref:helix-turn-helix domain-containing protein n=3 Tax=Glutamicibacter ardleyensis TaxID=225894 RepID=UPI003FCEE888
GANVAALMAYFFSRDGLLKVDHTQARARGRTGGRPASLSPDKLHTAKRLYEQRDMTVTQIGEVLGVSRSTVYRALNKS